MIDTADLTVAGLLKVRIRHLLYAPLGKDKALGVSTQGLIVLDPRNRSPLARTLLHELIHVKRPMWSESRTLHEDARLWHASTWREKAELYRLLGKGRVWTGEEQEFDADEDAAAAVAPAAAPPKHAPDSRQTPMFPGVDPRPLPK